VEAQKEIVDYVMTRLQQFLDGERDFDDAMTGTCKTGSGGYFDTPNMRMYRLNAQIFS
jgi:hypothetical protein